MHAQSRRSWNCQRNTADGKKTVKAITVSLLDDGTFFAAFDDCRIIDRDDFINRPDSEAIPRDILYAPEESINQTERYPADDGPVTDSGSSEDLGTEDSSKESGIDIQDAYDTGTDNVPDGSLEEAEAAASAYYSGTVFQVVEMGCTEQSETKAIFSVKISRSGVIQEPDRTITLQLKGGVWEVTNEGY